MYYASEKKKRPKEKMLPMYNSKSTSDITSAPSAQELETEILNAQKRALIIEIIKPVVMMKNNKLNENI